MVGLFGLTALDILLLFLYGLCLLLVLGSFRRSVPGTKRARMNVVPALAGAIGLALLALRHGSPPLSPLWGTPRAAVLGAGIVFLVVAVGEFLLVNLPSWILTLVRRPPEQRATNLAMLLTVALPLAIGLGALEYVERTLEEEDGTLAIHDLPGLPTDIVLTEELGGYIAIADGSILRFRLPEGDGRLELQTIADGLGFLRGIAAIDRTLFVGEIVDLPCDPPVPTCKGYNVGGSPEEGEMAILTSTRGRILAFDLEDGEGGTPRVVLDDLPVVNTEHGVNGIAMGPDGFLYIAIGHVEILWERPDVVQQLDVPNSDLLGTILRVDPETGETQIFARGVRNVYGLAFDDRGRLFGVDNDGPTRQGWRTEELLEIEEGLDYGYPLEGTFGPELRTGFPVWVLGTRGTAGITWDDHPELGPRLLIGGQGELIQVRLSDRASGRPGSRADVTSVTAVPGFVTAVEVLPGDRIVAAVFGWDGRSALYILDDPAGRST